MHILLSVTDNCPTWISDRKRMAIEMVSWPISMKECWRTRGSNPRASACQVDAHPIELRVRYQLNCHSYFCTQPFTIEPPHDKTNKMTVHPVETQISLGFCPVWSESSQCVQWVAENPVFLHADSKDSDQTGCMPQPIRVFTGCMPFCWFCHEAAHLWLKFQS